MTDYRVKIYKQDKRHRSGERLEVTYDYLAQTDEMFQMAILDLKTKNYSPRNLVTDLTSIPVK